MAKHSRPMSQPNAITRKQLRTEMREMLSNHPTKADLKRELSNHPTKADLKRELSNYPTKADLKRELSNYSTKADLKRELSALKAELFEEMARHVRAVLDEARAWFSALDDKYKDLPPRVERLEQRTGI